MKSSGLEPGEGLCNYIHRVYNDDPKTVRGSRPSHKFEHMADPLYHITTSEKGLEAFNKVMEEASKKISDKLNNGNRLVVYGTGGMINQNKEMLELFKNPDKYPGTDRVPFEIKL